jgi:transcriptional regulator with XRE-family HTH domain
LNQQQIGKQVAERRQVLGIDQKTAAALSGVSVHTFSNVESGKGNPSMNVLNKMLDALGLDLRIQLKQIHGDNPLRRIS